MTFKLPIDILAYYDENLRLGRRSRYDKSDVG
jgi:hypothetical protein